VLGAGGVELLLHIEHDGIAHSGRAAEAQGR
jgi:hypothetical protein